MANALGDFLRARRARVKPGNVGLPSGSGTRRTPGLRREEIAALAGLSIDYYIRLEQGKETNPSGAILDGLAQALRLNEEEHAHLYALANHVAGRVPRTLPRANRVVRPEILQLLETLRPYPAHVLTRTSDLLAANPESIALFAGLADWPPERRNTARYTFLHPAARELFTDWDRAAEEPPPTSAHSPRTRPATRTWPRSSRSCLTAALSSPGSGSGMTCVSGAGIPSHSAIRR